MSLFARFFGNKPQQPQQYVQQQGPVRVTSNVPVTVHFGNNSSSAATSSTVVGNPVEHDGNCEKYRQANRNANLTDYRGHSGWNPFAQKCAECPLGTTFKKSFVGKNTCVRSGGRDRKTKS